MFDIIETYQEEAALKTEEPKDICYATVKTISSSGMNVQFDGETTTSTKAYAFNVAGQFAVNDRVLMQKVNGEYVAMATIGKEQRGGGSSINVIDNLNSTSATDALSANQGRVLKGMIPTTDIKYEVTTKSVGNISAGGSGTGNASFSKSGYTLANVCAYSSSAKVLISAYVNGGKVYYSYYNAGTSAASLTLNLTLLWIK